jgi:hypothetical protein
MIFNSLSYGIVSHPKFNANLPVIALFDHLDKLVRTWPVDLEFVSGIGCT